MYREIVDWPTSKILCPDLLGDVIAGVSASHDQCLAEGEFPRAAFSLVPWFFEQFFYAFL